MSRRFASLLVAFAIVGWSTVLGSVVHAQGKKSGKSGGFGDLGLPTVGGFAGGSSLSYEAQYEIEKGTNQGRLSVTARVAPGYHTYSLTQADGPTPTQIEIVSDFVQIKGRFRPDRAPHIGFDERAYPGIPIEEYDSDVTWTAQVEFTRELVPEQDDVTVEVDGLVCSSSCTPVNETLSAKFAGYYGGQPTSDSLRAKDTHGVWTAKIVPAQVRPGEKAVLELSVKTDKGYHVYQFTPTLPVDDDGIPDTVNRTLIVAKTKSGLRFGEPQASTEIESMLGLEEVKYYAGSEVTWSIPIQVPASAETGEFPIELLVGFNTCNDRSCDPPTAVMATGSLLVDSSRGNSNAAMALSEINFADVAGSPKLTNWIDGDAADVQVAASGESADEPAQSLTLIHVLAGLAGGFILNFMPCVLPVIGLKVMSFVNQAGNSHRRVVTLNLAFVGGILAVMLLLALATVTAKLIWGTTVGWGEQFTVLEFKVALAGLVFAMALSFLGVWEIPIPGFATSSKSGELMEQEGHWGAFIKGILTTVLATPCSGPLLGALFGLSLVLAPLNVILLYLVVGIGMSLPYLALCVYPGFIKMLPKPGAWMDTLKQALAFPLLLTAVFFVASIDEGHRIATLIFLIVVWFACWLIGRVPAYAEKAQVRTAWLTGLATVAGGALVSFMFFGPINSELPWVPYNSAKLAQLRSEGKTVMIDFTANWCLNCQINTRVAIERTRVAALVEENDVIPMLADWTEPSKEIKAKLDELQSASIPLMVVYPADPGAEPIVLRDLISESDVIAALKQAGPSLPKAQLTSIQ